jgi:hypothetical protein
MPADVRESWADRHRANEDEYFRKRDQELVEKARLRAEDEAGFQRLAEAAGVSDEDILRGLQRLGYTAETVTLHHVVPLIDVAWAHGNVSEPERDVIIASGACSRRRAWVASRSSGGAVAGESSFQRGVRRDASRARSHDAETWAGCTRSGHTRSAHVVYHRCVSVRRHFRIPPDLG